MLQNTLPYKDIYWDGSIHFKHIPIPLVDFILVRSANDSSIQPDNIPLAQECVLHYCVKNISAKFSQGTYSERVVSTVFNDSVPSVPLSHHLSGDGKHEAYDLTYNITLSSQGEDFHVSNLTNVVTRLMFDIVVPLYLKSINGSSHLEITYYDDADAVVQPKTVRAGSLSWMTTDGKSSYIDDLATALTNAMRIYPNSSDLVTDLVQKRHMFVLAGRGWRCLLSCSLRRSYSWLSPW